MKPKYRVNSSWKIDYDQVKKFLLFFYYYYLITPTTMKNYIIFKLAGLKFFQILWRKKGTEVSILIIYSWDLGKQDGCGVVTRDRLTEPRVSIEWLPPKPSSLSDLPAFLCSYGMFVRLIIFLNFQNDWNLKAYRCRRTLAHIHKNLFFRIFSENPRLPFCSKSVRLILYIWISFYIKSKLMNIFLKKQRSFCTFFGNTRVGSLSKYACKYSQQFPLLSRYCNSFNANFLYFLNIFVFYLIPIIRPAAPPISENWILTNKLIV